MQDLGLPCTFRPSPHGTRLHARMGTCLPSAPPSTSSSLSHPTTRSNPFKGIERYGMPLLQMLSHYVIQDLFTTLLNAPTGRFLFVFFAMYLSVVSGLGQTSTFKSALMHSLCSILHSTLTLPPMLVVPVLFAHLHAVPSVLHDGAKPQLLALVLVQLPDRLHHWICWGHLAQPRLVRGQ
jgi:hypothetical protein